MNREILEILKMIAPDSDFENSKDFFEDGLIDSFGIMTLVTLLEEKYQISIRGEDISADSFINLECIGNLIEKYARS